MTGMACLSPRGLALEVGGALRAQHVALGPHPGSKSGIGEAQPSLRPLDCPWVWNETGKARGGLHLTSPFLQGPVSPTFAFLTSGLPHTHSPTHPNPTPI